jgi:hypothetical protein
MSGKERRGGGVFGRRGRSYQTRTQRVAQSLRFTGRTAVEVLGSVDELTDGTVRSIDATTVAGIGPYRESRIRRNYSPPRRLFMADDKWLQTDDLHQPPWTEEATSGDHHDE